MPIVDPDTGLITGGIRKFVDLLPGLGTEHANDLPQPVHTTVRGAGLGPCETDSPAQRALSM